MPERTRKVPTMIIENATTPSIIVQARSRRAREHARRMEQRGRREPRHQRGILDGSQNHQPPQPSS